MADESENQPLNFQEAKEVLLANSKFTLMSGLWDKIISRIHSEPFHFKNTDGKWLKSLYTA